MDGQFNAFKQGDEYCVVQQLARKFKEDLILNRAKIQNNSHPRYKNGHPKSKEKTGG